MSVLSETYEPIVYVNPSVHVSSLTWTREDYLPSSTVYRYTQHMFDLLKTCKLEDYCATMVVKAHQITCEWLHGYRHSLGTIYDDVQFNKVATEIIRERGSHRCMFECDSRQYHMGLAIFMVAPFPQLDQQFTENPFNSYTERNVITGLRSRDLLPDSNSWL